MTMTLREALQAAVDERGADYVYPAKDSNWSNDDYHYEGVCVYRTPNGDPACIFGLALTKMGLYDYLPHYRREEGIDAVLRLIMGRTDHTFTPTEIRAASAAQYAQDNYADYGTVLETYDTTVMEG